LRTPLNPVFMLLSEMRRDVRLPDSVRQDLATIQRNLDLEARLIDDLLDVTRIVRGKFTLRPETCDVHDLLRRTVETCAANGEHKNLHVRLQLNAESYAVAGDPTRLQQVFWNLLNNAIKFTPPGGSITIETRSVDGRLGVEFTDTGRGIAAEMLERIFRPFEQGDIAHGAELGGLGLGLTIAQAVVQAHGGQIQAHSAGHNQGATFSIQLPVVVSKTAAPAEPSARGGESAPGKWRILLVDDHPDTLKTLQRILISRGHIVTTARDATSALAVVNQQPVNLLISDIGLPDRSGLELMREARQIQNLKGIALSGYGADTDIQQSRVAGFFGHLTKPIDVQELFGLIEKATRG
jgi:CheY-like chemotaxis protein